jgi:uncharacterized membrane protein
MTTEQHDLLLNLSASLLLALLLLALIAGTVLLYLTWHALRSARRNLPGFLAELDDALGQVESAAYDTSSAALGKSIRVVSAWQGVRTGFRVLIGRPKAHDAVEVSPPV